MKQKTKVKGTKFHVGWSFEDKEVVWITEGKNLNDFCGDSMAFYKKEARAVALAILNLLDEEK